MSRQYRLIAMTNPVDGQETEFNAWYDRHLNDILRIPGIVAAQRFKLVARQRSAESSPYRYLAIYDIDCDDIEAVYREMDRRIGTDEAPLSPAMDTKRSAFFFEPISSVVTGQGS